MMIHHRKRCKRYNAEGDAHHLTFSCYHCLPLLSKERSCSWLLQALQLGREKGQFHLWAFVIMPEHVHLVLWPRNATTISQILTTLKQSVSKRAWQTGKDEPIAIDRGSLPSLMPVDQRLRPT